MSVSDGYCVTCTQVLPAESPLGLCPNCLLQRTLNPEGAAGMMAGPYRLLELIGEGAYGEVYIGEQSEPVRREAAVKLLKTDHIDSSAAQRFQAEAQALALLDHPNIARLYEAGTTAEGQPYLAIELVPGVTLNAWCDQQGAGISERVAIFRKVCDAIAHAHQRGLIHRDLKPENILVDPETGEPKVIDFGIARSTSAMLHDSAMLTGEFDIVGTPAYLSPEQTDGGDAALDERADIYALGSVLYELLTGKTTLAAAGLPEGHFELLRSIRETVPPSADTLNPEISTRLASVISKALAKNPDDRFASVAEFENAIASPSEIAVESQSPKSHRILWSVAVAAAVIIAIFGLIALLPDKEKPDSETEAGSPPSTEAFALKGYSPPFVLVHQDFVGVDDVSKVIAPFDAESRFSWYRFRDSKGKVLLFAADLRYQSPSSGEFLIGAKSADQPGASHVLPESPEDIALVELLTSELPKRLSTEEIEKLISMDWDDTRDRQTRMDKNFATTVSDLHARRNYRKEEGTW